MKTVTFPKNAPTKIRKPVDFPKAAPITIRNYSKEDVEGLSAMVEKRKQQLAILNQVKDLEVELKEVEDQIGDVLRNKTVDDQIDVILTNKTVDNS